MNMKLFDLFSFLLIINKIKQLYKNYSACFFFYIYPVSSSNANQTNAPNINIATLKYLFESIWSAKNLINRI